MNEIWMPDIPRIYTAVGEWMACMVFVLLAEKRFSWWKTALISAAGYAFQVEFMMRTVSAAAGFWWIFCMAVAVCAMVVFLRLCCKVSWLDALFWGMLAFVSAEFMTSLEWQVTCYISQWNVPSWLQAKTMVFLFYNASGLLLYLMLRNQIPKKGGMQTTRREGLSAFVIAVGIFTVSNLSFISIDTPFSSDYSFQIGNIRTFVDVAGVAILYSQLLSCRDHRVRRELEAVRSALENQYLQYQLSKESIELINYKYHDLKHQIAYLRSEESPEKREEFLKRMENEIRQYDAQNRTGNKVLDTILTAKSLYCAKNEITMTCVADGTLVDFMDEMDICSIFGNALDNAIESVQKLPNPEERLIHVTVSRQKAFVLLKFENYCGETQEPQKEHGNFVTTKKDKNLHGYGLKSIHYSAEKYKGAVSITIEKGWFSLRILFPVQSPRESGRQPSS